MTALYEDYYGVRAIYRYSNNYFYTVYSDGSSYIFDCLDNQYVFYPSADYQGNDVKFIADNQYIVNEKDNLIIRNFK